MLKQKESSKLGNGQEALLWQYSGELYGYALKLCKDPFRAQDLVQDTFVKALSAFRNSGYQDIGQLKAWLFKILYNCFVNEYRRSQRLQFVSGDALLGNEMSPFQTRSQEDTAIDRDLVDVVIAKLESSGHAQFVDPLLLTDGLGYKKMEAATKLGIPQGTVMSQIFRARKLCRNALGDVAA